MKSKCVLLYSGGLDSIVVYYLLREQGVEVILLRVVSPFIKKEGVFVSEGAEVIEEELGQEYLELIENPDYGTGKNFNPCVDCRIEMLKKAKQIMDREDAGFIATGEVLGQRPMSQKKDVFNFMDKRANLKGLVLRPLSAQLLPETIPEEKGIVKREELLDIQGRSRRIQRELSEKFGIDNYPNSSGGCLLTEKAFSSRIKDLLQSQEEFSLDNANLLKYGRHFRITPYSKLIVARNKEESEKIFNMRDKYVILKTKGYIHPCTLYTGKIEDDLSLCIDIFGFYAYKVAKINHVNIEVLSKGKLFWAKSFPVKKYLPVKPI